MKVEMLRVKIVCEYSSNPFSFNFIATCHTCIGLGLKVTVIIEGHSHTLFTDLFIVNFTKVVKNKTSIYDVWQFIQINIHCSFETSKSSL